MNTRPRAIANQKVVSAFIFLFLVLTAIVINSTDILEHDRARFRDQVVPTSLLDYGEKGKILKYLGLVYSVRNEQAHSAVDAFSWDPQDRLFKRKRQQSEYTYLANPGNVFQLPSTAIIEPDSFRDNWTLVSLAMDEPALKGLNTGIVANPTRRGKKWERRATVSYFNHSKLEFAANTGVRVHGTKRTTQFSINNLDQSYRLYFRNDYGVPEVPKGVVFDGGQGIRRLVIKKQRLFAGELSFDVAHRLGAEISYYKPIIFYLNGKRMGIRTLFEQPSEPQWVNRLGHEDLYFFKHKDDTSADSKLAFGKLARWFYDNRAEIGLNMASQYVDIRNLTRNLFTFMFCGTNDWYRAAAVLDRAKENAKWRWIIGEMDGSFVGGQHTSMNNPWEKKALTQVVVGDSETRLWQATHRDFRSLLFESLMNNDALYRDYFLRTVTDVLNHELTPEFFSKRFEFYDGLIDTYKDAIPEKDIRQFQLIKDFARHRARFIRRSLQDQFSRTRFNLGKVYTVSVVSPEKGTEYVVDDYPVQNSYSGKYFEGQRITIRTLGKSTPKGWLVNGEIIPIDVLDIAVRSDMEVKPLL